ncbi:MAG: hypothetical protein GDA40_08520 [Rhodobacteraceae bacterium]|nr:hypothetical protein [Paracoccaceae bacterium]
MGDRTHIIFTTGYSVSATIYLQLGWPQCAHYINSLRQLANGEEELCPGYAAAQFVGVAHEHIPGVMSLGVF